MGELVAVLIVVAGGVYQLCSRLRKEAVSRATWRTAAGQCGLTANDDVLPGDGLSFRGDGLTVYVDSYRRQADAGTRVEIRTEHGGFTPASLHGRAIATSYQKHEQVVSGDESFDRDVIVTGTEADVLAALDAETRDVLSSAVIHHELQLAFGVVRAHVAHASATEALREFKLVKALRLVLDGAARLRRKGHAIAGLAHNAGADPVAAVRARNLLALVRAHPRHETTARTLRAACDDASAEVRLQAGIALGPDGEPTLMEVADDDGADDLCRARALAALGPRLPYWRAKAILERALRPRTVQTAQACLTVVAASAAADAGATLASVLRAPSSELAVAAARALGHRRACDAEGPLLESLGGADAELRVAAAEALAKVGTAHAIVALKEAAAADEHDRAFQRAVRQAVAEIQSRLTGASPGQLSLASPAGGALSLSDAEAGQLSFDDQTPRGGGGDDPQ